MEEDDPVVEEMPVYLSHSLAKHLYLLQFPVRDSERDFKEMHVVNAAVKPKNQMMRLEMGLDPDSDNFCPSKAEQIALNTDGDQESSSRQSKDKDKLPYFQSGIMDKVVYESTAPVKDVKQYAIGILQDKMLHITPLEGIMQMRPSLSYYDKQDKGKTDKNKVDNSEEEDKEAEAQQVTVKFARHETDVAKKAREKSFETVSQRAKDEPWYDTIWKHSDTDAADLERLKLFCQTSSDGSTLALPKKQYVRRLVPAPPDDEADVTPSKLPPPADQLRQILFDAKLMTFNDLRTLIRTETGPLAEATLLSTLGAAACCVRGLWAARSVDLYTHTSPVPSRLMCAARDHVLYLFTQHPFVDRRKVSDAVRLPPQEVLEIIKSVAKYNPKNGWELLVPPDTAFENKYPDIIQRQNLYWEARQRQFNEMMIGENITKRQRKKSQRDSVSSDSMLSPKPRCNSVSEEDIDKKRVKGKGVGKRTRNISSSSGQDT